MKIHIVQKGDTLWEIAKKYGVDFEELKALNSHLASPDMIMPGMKIRIPTHSKKVQHKDKTMPQKKEKQAPAPKTAKPKKKMIELPKMPTLPMESGHTLPTLEKQKAYPKETPSKKPVAPKKEVKHQYEEDKHVSQQMPLHQMDHHPIHHQPQVMPMYVHFCPCSMPVMPEYMGCGCGGHHHMMHPSTYPMHPGMYQQIPAQMYPQHMMQQPMYSPSAPMGMMPQMQQQTNYAVSPHVAQMELEPELFKQQHPTENANPYGDSSLQMYPEPPPMMRTEAEDSLTDENDITRDGNAEN